MFTKEELLAELPSFMEQDVLRIESTVFLYNDFDSPSSEEHIVIDRGRKTSFESALHFWVQSLRAQGWNGREEAFLKYAQTGKCIDITATDFDRLVKGRLDSLKVPLVLLPEGAFMAAMQMDDSWNEIVLLAEFKQEYIAFYWDTSA